MTPSFAQFPTPAFTNNIDLRRHWRFVIFTAFALWAGAGVQAQPASLAVPLGPPAQASGDLNRPVNPLEVIMTEAAIGGPFTLTPSGRFMLQQTSRGANFRALPDATLHRFDEISGDEDEELTGQFWSWQLNNDFGGVAFSADGSTLAAPVMVNGKTWIASGDMESRNGGKALCQIPKDFYHNNALAWSAGGQGVYLRLTYRLQRWRANPQDDNPPTANLNVTLRVSARYAPARAESELVPRVYPEAASAQNRDFIVYYDLAKRELRRVFTGNDITGIVFSPDQQQVAVWQTKQGVKHGVPTPLADVYLITLPPVDDLPVIDLGKAKEEERNAGWFDHRRQRLDPVVRDLGFSPRVLPVYRAAWAPDGSRFALFGGIEHLTRDVGVYDVAAKKFTLLTESDALSQTIAGLPWRLPAVPNASVCALDDETPRWTPDGRSLITTTTHGQIWRFAADGRIPAEDITPPTGPGVVQIFTASEAHNVAALSADGRLFVQTTDQVKGTDGLAWFDPVRREVSSIYQGQGMIHTGYLGTSGDRIYFSETVPDSVAQVYELPLAGGAPPRPLTQYFADLKKRIWPERQLLRFTTKSGLIGSARLHLPPGAAKDRLYPLVLVPNAAYAFSDVAKWRVNGAAIMGLESIWTTPWIDHGYAVMEFDVPMSRYGVYADPLKQAAEGYEAATDAALTTGRIDPARLVLYGQDYAGYLVQGVIGRSERYRAAVSMAGYGSLSTFAFLGGEPAAERVRGADGRMELDFIDAPQRYLDAAPIASFRKVKTPLLLIAGEGSMPGSNTLADESFSALAPTGVPSVRAVYNKYSNDVMPRVFTWLDEHLNGGPVTSGLATLPEPVLGEAKKNHPAAAGK